MRKTDRHRCGTNLTDDPMPGAGTIRSMEPVPAFAAMIACKPSGDGSLTCDREMAEVETLVHTGIAGGEGGIKGHGRTGEANERHDEQHEFCQHDVDRVG